VTCQTDACPSPCCALLHAGEIALDLGLHTVLLRGRMRSSTGAPVLASLWPGHFPAKIAMTETQARAGLRLVLRCARTDDRVVRRAILDVILMLAAL
jgi:hypothetical protein